MAGASLTFVGLRSHGSHDPSNSEATMQHFSTREWVEAGSVVAGSAAIGGLVATLFTTDETGKPNPVAILIGVGLGLAVGLAINWLTECPVCKAHLEGRA